eukprot:CAMPEP_0179490948 /NCGR_PEP_ID=MMETSP0799-20121207/65784_1 /TAXON_ID=46947 /ORGANISM="Geminigera cryophila, Strain CCMP2564" /LENGTH=252 /DNA_ID=CAMNT_0021307281 /DNA_START=57 /DNA_END=815 /DNA_ORIENTATION=+
MASICCEYKVARRGMLITNMLVIVFAFIFIGVGTASLSYATAFQDGLDSYCIQKCAENKILKMLDPVGCSCDTEPGHTTLPTVVFVTPAIGLIIIGVFTFIASTIGCIGAIRERPVLIYVYVCILFVVIILQFSFGGAAGAVASGNAKEIQGPLEGALRENYRKFDWENLKGFFPPACYAGQTVAQVTNSTTAPMYQYPLCETGSKCLNSFFVRAAGPVATMCFLPIFLEIMCIIFACLIRQGAAVQSKNYE